MGKSTTKLSAYNAGLLQGKAYAGLYEKLMQALSPFNISVPEWKLLGQVYDNNQIKLSDLAEKLRYDPPMVTKLVKSLEKKGLLKRKQDPADERAKMIVATESGIKLIKKAEPDVKKMMSVILEGASSKEFAIYIKVLKIIDANAGKR